jgi:hypothetical protein
VVAVVLTAKYGSDPGSSQDAPGGGGGLPTVAFCLTFAIALPLSMRLPFLRRSQEVVVERAAARIYKRTPSKVFPEVAVADFVDLKAVQVASRTYTDRDSRGVGGTAAPYTTKRRRRSLGIFLRRKSDHPEAPGELLLHSRHRGDTKLFRLFAQRISQFAGVPLEDDLDP